MSSAAAAARLLLVSMLFVSSTAYSTTIDFESIPGMNYFSGNPVPAASRLSDQFLGSAGVRFSSTGGSDYIAVVQLGSGHATSGVNGIGGATAAGILSYAPETRVRVTFFVPGSPSRVGDGGGGEPNPLGVTNFVSIRGDRAGFASQTATLYAYGINDQLLASNTKADLGGTTWQINMAGIHAVEFSMTPNVNAGIALDDLSFNTPTAAAVPEPLAAAVPLALAAMLPRRRRLPPGG